MPLMSCFHHLMYLIHHRIYKTLGEGWRHPSFYCSVQHADKVVLGINGN